jgi:hypothetical protein
MMRRKIEVETTLNIVEGECQRRLVSEVDVIENVLQITFAIVDQPVAAFLADGPSTVTPAFEALTLTLP